MIQPKNITVGGMAIHAFGCNDRAAHEWPCFEIFTGRTDFFRKGVRKLAVAFTATRPEGRNIKKAATASMRARLTNASTGTVLNERTFSIRFEAGEQTTAARVDMAIWADSVSEIYDYSVELIDMSGLRTYASCPLHFYDNFYPDIKGACISDTENTQSLLGTIDRYAHKRLSARFYFSHDAMIDPLPEMQLFITDSDGKAGTPLCKKPDKRHKIAFELDTDDLPHGEVYAELRCLGHALAGFTFYLSDHDEPGHIFHHVELLPRFFRPVKDKKDENQDEFERLLGEFIDTNLDKEDEDFTLEEVEQCSVIGKDVPENLSGKDTEPSPWDELDHLVGLTGVKTKLRSYTTLMEFYNMRCKAGLKMQRPPLHALFLGAPGTGKTTVAKILGRLLKDAGVLSKGHVVIRERTQIVGKYYGDEQKSVAAALEEAEGGILFIDEAYQLNKPEDPRDPGRLALEALLTTLADTGKRDLMVVLAGYTAPMLDMLKVNPGLASRFPVSNHYTFDDFSPEELEEIAVRYLADNEYYLPDDTRYVLSRVLRTDFEHRDESFGNARHVVNLLENGVLPAMAARVTSMACPTVDDLKAILPCDIPAVISAPRYERQRVGFAV